MRVYLDSCVVIYRTEGSAPVRGRINHRLLSCQAKPATVAHTDLVRLECRVKPLEAGNAVLLADDDDFFATPGYLRQMLDSAVFDLATELRAAHRLKIRDALHLAAAIATGCDEFWTNDHRLTRAADGRVHVLTIDQL